MNLLTSRGSIALRLIGWGVLAWLAAACAQQGTPQGGPRDEIPPLIEKTDPEIGTLRYDDSEVTIYFSEIIRKPTFDKEVFISPLVKRPDLRLSDNGKRLTIKFQEALRPKTTYIITLNDVQDANEGNKLAETYVLAFSTGDRLDSAQMRGRIFLPELGKGAAEMSVLLFDPDSIQDQDFLLKRPAYLTKTNEQGEFTFQYLRDAPYRILGVKDGDQSNSYSLPSEQIAILLDSLVIPQEKVSAPLPTSPDSLPKDTVASDSLLGADSVATVITDSLPGDRAAFLPATDDPLLKLLAFVPDTLAPILRGYDFGAERTLILALTEFPRLDTLEVWVSDTNRQDSARPLALTAYRGGEEISLLIGLDRAPPLDLILRHLSDSLYNRIDTTLRVAPERLKKLERPVLQPPQLQSEARAWRVLLPRLLGGEVQNLVQVTDTSRFDSARATFAYTYEADGFYLLIRPEKLPEPAAPYVLSVAGEAGLTDTALLDSQFRYQLDWINPEGYGTLSGRVQLDSGYQGGIVLQLRNQEGKIVRTVYDTTFSFTQLKEGDYTFRVILDRDRNQTYTPGQLLPLRWPERTYVVPEKVTIRGQWDFEDHLVRVPITDRGAINRQPPPEAEPNKATQDTNSPGSRPEATNDSRPPRSGKRP